jgi:hypothetical protein
MRSRLLWARLRASPRVTSGKRAKPLRALFPRRGTDEAQQPRLLDAARLAGCHLQKKPAAVLVLAGLGQLRHFESRQHYSVPRLYPVTNGAL